MGRRIVTAGAFDFRHAARRNADRIAGDVVVLGGVAVLTHEIVAAGVHVDVGRALRIGHGRIEVAVLDRVAAAAEEVALTAVLTHRLADVLGNVNQVDIFARNAAARGRFVVGAGGVVADQAVDFGLVGEVEGVGVGHAVTGVAAGAGIFVGGDRGAVVVQRVALAALVNLAVDFLLARPVPVAGLHEIRRRIFVTLQALLGHFGAGGHRAGDTVLVAAVGQCRQGHEKCQGCQ